MSRLPVEGENFPEIAVLVAISKLNGDLLFGGLLRQPQVEFSVIELGWGAVVVFLPSDVEAPLLDEIVEGSIVGKSRLLIVGLQLCSQVHGHLVGVVGVGRVVPLGLVGGVSPSCSSDALKISIRIGAANGTSRDEHIASNSSDFGEGLAGFPRFGAMAAESRYGE